MVNSRLCLLGGVGLGAGLMYVLDPEVGRRRRALARDKLTAVMSRAENYVDTTRRDLANRTQGLKAELRSRLAAEPVDDSVLVERVRSKIGRYVSHPHALGVTGRDGKVLLTGSVLASEVDGLLDAVSSVRGEADVDASSLVVHHEAGDLPWLQGGRARPGERLNLMEAHWAPATRLLVGIAGGALLSYGFTQRFPIACVLGTAGIGLLATVATNTEMRRLLSWGNGRFAESQNAPSARRGKETTREETGVSAVHAAL